MSPPALKWTDSAPPLSQYEPNKLGLFQPETQMQKGKEPPKELRHHKTQMFALENVTP